MKKITFIFFVFIFNSSYCQEIYDKLIKKDGTLIECKVLRFLNGNVEINPKDEKVPFLLFPEKDVKMIIYSNNEIRTFDSNINKTETNVNGYNEINELYRYSGILGYEAIGSTLEEFEIYSVKNIYSKGFFSESYSTALYYIKDNEYQKIQFEIAIEFNYDGGLISAGQINIYGFNYTIVLKENEEIVKRESYYINENRKFQVLTSSYNKLGNAKSWTHDDSDNSAIVLNSFNYKNFSVSPSIIINPSRTNETANFEYKGKSDYFAIYMNFNIIL